MFHSWYWFHTSLLSHKVADSEGTQWRLPWFKGPSRTLQPWDISLDRRWKYIFRKHWILILSRMEALYICIPDFPWHSVLKRKNGSVPLCVLFRIFLSPPVTVSGGEQASSEINLIRHTCAPPRPRTHQAVWRCSPWRASWPRNRTFRNDCASKLEENRTQDLCFSMQMK